MKDLFSVPVGTVPQEDPEYAESGHLFPPGLFEKYQGKWVALSGWDILAVRDTRKELRAELGNQRPGLSFFHVPSESDILILQPRGPISRRRIPYESRNVPALRMLLETRGGPVVELNGIVDSGATCTVLSLEDADELGLSDLRKAHDATLAGGIQIPAWVSDTPIRAQAQAPIFPNGPHEPWGPIFELHPMFLESGPPLWGQEDFCATFQITLQRHLNPAHFVLEY